MAKARRMIQCNLAISNGDAITTAIQIPNGATKLTIQFNYSGLDDDVSITMLQSLDGVNFDTCMNENDEPVSMSLDHSFSSMTMNIADLLTAWIKFSMDVGEATTGTLDKIFLTMV